MTGKKTKSDLQPFAVLERTICLFRELDPAIKASRVRLFIEIALKPDLSIEDLSKRLKIAQPTASRNVAFLGDGTGGKKGYGLVETRKDPHNPPRNMVRLTPAGHALAQKMKDAFT